jgi:hypothetical protein
MNITAVLQLGSVRTADATSTFINRYAILCDAPAVDFLTANVTRRTKAGNLWHFDPNSADAEIRDRSATDVEYFRQTTGKDLNLYLPVGTLIIVSTVNIPQQYFLQGYRASVNTKIDDKGGLMFYPAQHPAEQARIAARDAETRELHETMRASGLKTAEQRANVLTTAFVDIAKAHIAKLSTRVTVDLTQIDLSALPTVTPVTTPVVPASEPLEAPDFGNSADESLTPPTGDDSKAPF